MTLDNFTCLEERCYGSGQFRPILDQLSSTDGKYIHLCSANNEPKVLEEPADLVLNIPLDLDEQGSADQKGFDRMTVEVFDADLLVPIRIA